MAKSKTTKAKNTAADELKSGYSTEVRAHMMVLAAQVHGSLKLKEVNLARVLFTELAWYFNKPTHVTLYSLPSVKRRTKK